MRMRFLGGALVFGLLGCTAPALAWDVDCGKEGQAPCSTSKARFERDQKGGFCPGNQFYDLIDGGTCWSCPSGHARTIPWGVNTDKACEKASSTDFRRVTEHGKGTGWFGTDCPSGQFWDIVDGNCHSCPDGYSMMFFEHVHGDKKCARGIPNSYARATSHGPVCGAGNFWDLRNGGECWSCPGGFVRTIAPVTSEWACEYKGLFGGTGLRGCREGLSSIRNVCRKTGDCGKANQRPCEIGERFPSCEPNLKEDFKQNLCLPVRPGETPFTGGLSSLGGFLGSSLQLRCLELLGNIGGNGFGLGARCSRDAAVGLACVLARDVATGYPDLINSLLEKGPETYTLAERMNAAANATPCKELAERFSRATRHDEATGQFVKLDCPAGQFWDPDSWCHSCPQGYTRTLYPVTHERACTDQIGGNLARFACGAYKGIEGKFSEPIKCTVEVLENGSIFDRKLDLSKANQIACQATGELGYYMVRAAIDLGKTVATGDVSSLVSTIGKASGAAVKASDLKRLMECAQQK